MYAVEVNLLKDRPGYRQAGTNRPQILSGFDQGPLFLGIAAGTTFLGLALASLLVLTLLNQRLTARESELEGQLAEIAPQFAKVESFKAQQKQVTAETAALASVFNQVKPWSALLQDLRDRLPPRLQITNIQQGSSVAASAGGASTPAPAASPSPSASPSPTGGAPAAPPTGELTIKGNALSFGDINDFVLALQNSPFLKANATQLIQSQLQEATQPGATSLAGYQIQSSSSDVPASELLQELNRKGATGLVTRIRTLQQKGVIQP
ncbi:MAG TPA: PilN domain-containing protein [Candidatus Caenarcaniphilales bacterium]